MVQTKGAGGLNYEDISSIYPPAPGLFQGRS